MDKGVSSDGHRVHEVSPIRNEWFIKSYLLTDSLTTVSLSLPHQWPLTGDHFPTFIKHVSCRLLLWKYNFHGILNIYKTKLEKPKKKMFEVNPPIITDNLTRVTRSLSPLKNKNKKYKDKQLPIRNSLCVYICVPLREELKLTVFDIMLSLGFCCTFMVQWDRRLLKLHYRAL